MSGYVRAAAVPWASAWQRQTWAKHADDARHAAAIFAGPQSIRVAQVALPEPGPHEVRIRLEGCGVCASNLPVWEGRPWLAYPLEPGAPGHEGWGWIDAVGRAVRGLAVGERVDWP